MCFSGLGPGCVNYNPGLRRWTLWSVQGRPSPLCVLDRGDLGRSEPGGLRVIQGLGNRGSFRRLDTLRLLLGRDGLSREKTPRVPSVLVFVDSLFIYGSLSAL